MINNKIDTLNKINNFFNVLYIESNKDTQKKTLIILKKFFSNITCANDVVSGFELYNQQSDSSNINLILTDIQTQDLDGLEMIRKIRIKDLKTPIIILLIIKMRPLEQVLYT